jgi:hypothetical protein
VLGGLVERYRAFWVRLGRLETATLARRLAGGPAPAPIFVSGLARSGSTLLHEIVSSHPAVATHRVKDFPLVFTPYWWRRATARVAHGPPRERAHGDGMYITGDSPDALEEMIWAAFFPGARDPALRPVLTAADAHPAFETFYDAHLRKVLLAEGRERYAAKDNYHVGRLSYLLRLYPDARVLIPVRAPAGNVASLVRQHRRFAAGHRRYPRSEARMRRAGHFEFGRLRRPLALGNPVRAREILAMWAGGAEARGYAACWDLVYGHLAGVLATDARVRAAALVVRYEDLAAAPAETIRAVLAHCRLARAEELTARWGSAVRPPTTRGDELSGVDVREVEAETAATARLWGYPPGGRPGKT